MLGAIQAGDAVALIQKPWDRLKNVPGGKAAFSKVLGLLVPYSGSIGFRVEEISQGYARVRLSDKRSVRNHLRSIHAIALANVAELTGNLALLYSCPPNARMIITGLSIDYLKKARGAITAECRCEVPPDAARREYQVPIELKDRSGELVSKASLKALIGPKR